MHKGLKIPNAMGIRCQKHPISTSDFKSHPETKAKVRFQKYDYVWSVICHLFFWSGSLTNE
jgi:hypothetical protein